MRRPEVIATCTLVAFVSLVSGCRNSIEARSARTPTPAARASASATPTTTGAAVCRGIPDCRVELMADIDGDGVRDQVATVGHLKQDPTFGPYWPADAKPVLRILVGTQVLTYNVPLAGQTDGHLVRGAAAIDGLAGDELLLGYADGAHGSSETVVTLRRGRLVPLASPEPWDPTIPGAVGAWGADGSIRSNLGWHCLSGARVESFSADGVDKPGGGVDYTTSHRTWRWTVHGWRPTSEEVTRTHQPGPSLGEEYSDWTGCGTFAKYRPYTSAG
jgi:hypothetical protein